MAQIISFPSSAPEDPDLYALSPDKLRQLLEQDFDEDGAITVIKGRCIVADAQQIIAAEPF